MDRRFFLSAVLGLVLAPFSFLRRKPSFLVMHSLHDWPADKPMVFDPDEYVRWENRACSYEEGAW